MAEEVEERGLPRPPTNQLGVSGLNYMGNNVYEEFLPHLRHPRAIKVYQEMSSNDPVIGAVLYMSEQLIRKTPWRVEAGGSTQADLDAKQFLEECMHDMESTWDDFLAEALSCFVYGFSFHEIIYKYRRGHSSNGRFNSQYNDHRIGWRDFAPRAQSTLLGWEFDEVGNPTAFIQQSPPRFDTTTIPISRGLLFRVQATKKNPEGKSLLRNAYRPWYFKKRIEEIEGIGIERDLAGLPVIMAPQGFDIYDSTNPEAVKMLHIAQSIVSGVRRDSNEGLVLPADWEFKLLSTGGARQFDTSAIVTRYDSRIAMSLLSDIIMLGSNSVGSFAMAEVKKSLLAGALEAQLGMIAGVINRNAVEPLFRYNSFPGITKLPKLIPGEVETPDLDTLGNYFRSVGLRLDDDYELNSFIRQAASMPVLSEEEFEELQAKREKVREQTANATLQHTNDMQNTKTVDERGEYKITREGGSPDEPNT